jgi:hypothetical protein
MSPSTLKYYRVVLGLLGLSAVITEIVVLSDRGVFTPSNFFSYFTILSNIVAGLWLIWYGLRPRERSFPTQLMRGGVTLCMLMTGVIFAILLAPVEGLTLTATSWDNIVLHYIMPVTVAADWLLWRPKVRISRRQSLLWLAFPVAYVGYALMRGALIDRYPYPFLDATEHGYVQIGLTLAVLLIGIALGSIFLARFARPKRRA